MSEKRQRPALSTIAVALIDFVIAGFFLLLGIVIVLLPTVNLAGAAAALIGVFIVLITGWTILLGIKLLRRRPWARWWSLGTHVLFMLMLLVPVFRGELSGINRLEIGALVGTNVVVIALLLVPSTSRDFDQANRKRELQPAR
ncbi:MAG: YbjO family protein [Actinomycetota bacterium]|nr:YbjO family protein [Actinomycetota bacterium]